MRTIIAGCFICLLLVGTGITRSQSAPQDRMGNMPGMDHNSSKGGSAYDIALAEAMAKMDRGMNAVAMTGDPDRDMVVMMIPHHQGAIDMVNVYLSQGRDPEIRRIANDIITSQQQQIAQFQAWLAKHPAAAVDRR